MSSYTITDKMNLETSGAVFEFRMTLSRVSNGTLYTMLVAAMISSAESPSKSRYVDTQATARLIGQT